MGLLNKKNIKNLTNNKYDITKKDLIGDLKGFPIGVVVRMLEEQEMQGNKPDVTVFQKYINTDAGSGGFNWSVTEKRRIFWKQVLRHDFILFYQEYPEYKKYDE